MKRVLVRGGVVVEVLSPIDGFAFEDCFPPEIVAEAYPCSDEVQQGWLHEEGMFSPPPVAGLDMSLLKASLKASIDEAAERERLRYITPGAGQAMTYARKVDQARAVLAAGDPQPADYPMLAASIGIDGADIVAAAHTIIAMDAAWEAIGAAIEGARLAGKKAVDDAETAEAAMAVTVIWPEA